LLPVSCNTEDSVFFLASGVRLDLQGLLAQPSALLRVPVFLLALPVIRGLPAFLYVRDLGRPPTVAAALLQAPRCNSW
jgi:hypothetical protein